MRTPAIEFYILCIKMGLHTQKCIHIIVYVGIYN